VDNMEQEQEGSTEKIGYLDCMDQSSGPRQPGLWPVPLVRPELFPLWHTKWEPREL